MSEVAVVRIRKALPGDYDALLPLFFDLRRYSRQHHPPQRDDFELVLSASSDYLREILARDEDAVTLLAVANDGAMAGYFVAVVREPNQLTSSGAVRTGSIEELFVDDGYRGAGAGNALMTSAEGWFRRQGAERLEVGAYAWNDEAIAFYKRHGFVPTSVTLSKPLDVDRPD